MYGESGHNPATTISAIIGTLAGLYKAINAGTIFQTVLFTALSAAISSIVSFYLHQWLRKFKR